MRVKSISHLKTVQTMTAHSQVMTRSQVASRLARIEHEVARLKREEQIWEQKRKLTAEKLAMAESQAEQLANLLNELRATGPKARSSVHQDVETVALEY